MSRVIIKELRLRNYRAFADARLVLDDVTFLVGRNGAGKSTLMDAFSFVSEAVTDSLSTAYERRGGGLGLFPRHLYGEHERQESRRGISIAVCLQVERRDQSFSVLYGFTLGLDSTRAGDMVKLEVLRGDPAYSFERDENGFRPNTASLKPAPGPGALVLPLIAESNPTWKMTIEALRLISVHQFSPQAIRSAPMIGRETRLSRDGQNAGDILNRLQRKDRKWIEQHLAVAVPGIKYVESDTVQGRRVIAFGQEGSIGRVRPLDASQVSDGTLRSLGILLALRQTPRPSIVLFDEIEDSMHPHAHGVLLEAIDELSDEFPVVVSTHSPEILDHPTARGERIRVIQRNEGTSRIYDLSENVQENLKPPLTVGRLLRANALWTATEPATTGVEDDFFKL
jgi:predicted ATPase